MITFFLLIFGYAFFAACEMSFVSVDRLFIHSLAKQGVKSAQFAVKYLRNPEKYLGNVLVGQNVMLVALGIVATKLFYHNFNDFVITLISAFVLLILGEIIPKSLAYNYKEKVVLLAVYPLEVISYLFFPVVKLVQWTSKILLKILGIKYARYRRFTRDELKIASQKVLSRRETDIIARIMEFSEKRAKEIMIPADEMVTADVNSTSDELKELIAKTGFSRIPIYEGDKNNILGILHVKRLLRNERPIRELLTPCLVVSEHDEIKDILEDMTEQGQHFAIVKNEFGVTTGLITFEDIVEELIGEIQDEFDISKVFYSGGNPPERR